MLSNITGSDHRGAVSAAMVITRLHSEDELQGYIVDTIYLLSCTCKQMAAPTETNSMHIEYIVCTYCMYVSLSTRTFPGVTKRDSKIVVSI